MVTKSTSTPSSSSSASGPGVHAVLAMPYPWQNDEWEHVRQQMEQAKLPHALLLTGNRGLGKLQFALALAQTLLCDAPRHGRSCGNCRSCQLNTSVTHPDLLLITPEENSKTIKIDQIRAVSEFVAKTAQQGGKKVVVIAPAEGMNTNAANALLKNLEEPAGKTTLLLVSHSPSQLMATIRSRCQQLAFTIPSREQTRQWLSKLIPAGKDPDVLLTAAADAPLAALKLLDGDRIELRQQVETELLKVAQQQLSPLDVAQQWSALDVSELLDWLLIWLHQGAVAHSRPGAGPLSALLALVPATLIFRFYDKLLMVKRQLLSSANPNRQLVLEELLLDWVALTKKPVDSRHARGNGLV